MVQYVADAYEAVSSALKGMGVTIKHIWRKPVTQQYPDERWMLPDRYKGFVFNDIQRCNACNQCAKACPVSCIYIETEGKGKDRWMTRYAVDYNKCIWCGFCVEPCPDDALSMSHDYDHSVYFRETFVYEFVPPDNPVPCGREKRIEMGYWVPPKTEKEKPGKPEKPERTEKPERAEKPERGEEVERLEKPAPTASSETAAKAPPPAPIVDERPASAPDLPEQNLDPRKQPHHEPDEKGE